MQPLYVDSSHNYADTLWSKDQQRALAAVADAMIAPLTPEEKDAFLRGLPSEERARAAVLADMKFTDLPDGVNLVAMHVTLTVSYTLRLLMSTLLAALSTRAGCLALVGRVGPVWQVDAPSIRRFLAAWRRSPIQMIRMGEFGFRALTLAVFYRHMRSAAEAIGYPWGRTDDWKTPPKADEQEAIPPYEYRFLNEELPSTPTEAPVDVHADVVIVGSGCGGAVVAAYLAERGLQVVVVEKGMYVSADEMPQTQSFGLDQMFERLGFVPTSNLSLAILAGSGFGGGSTINWGATLMPRHYLREAWSQRFGMPYFQSSLFSHDLHACARRMGTTDDVTHNRANSLLMLGAHRSGQPAQVVPQNNAHRPHYCGKCTFGCTAGHKQGTVMTWLQDAAQHGAQFLTHCEVDRVIMDRGRATGVEATVRGQQRVRVHGRRGVVVSAGSLNTPAILLRTPALRRNQQIGRHLHLHPVAFVHGFYDKPVRPWQGAALTTVSNAAELVDPQGWGAKIEVMASAPALYCALLPYHDHVEHKSLAFRYPYSYTAIVIVRDRDGGRVKLDQGGRALVDYSLSAFDHTSLLEGVKRAIEIHMHAGASMIATSQSGVPVYTCPPRQENMASHEMASIPGRYELDDVPAQGQAEHPSFQAFLRSVERVGFGPQRGAIGSAHQMGSCRMGAHPASSACDPHGRVRGADNLWVADGSVLPEAAGVNPMLTILATSMGIARHIAEDLGVARPLDPPSLDAAPRAHL